jgi:hypothetical protein
MRKPRRVTAAATTAALPLAGDAVQCTHDDGWRVPGDGEWFRRCCLLAHGHPQEEHLWSGWVPSGETIAAELEDTLDRLGDAF